MLKLRDLTTETNSFCGTADNPTALKLQVDCDRTASVGIGSSCVDTHLESSLLNHEQQMEFWKQQQEILAQQSEFLQSYAKQQESFQERLLGTLETLKSTVESGQRSSGSARDSRRGH